LAGPTSILQTIVATAELIGLESVYAGEANVLPMDFERVAVENGRLADDLFLRVRAKKRA
jgi:hypothetical protein